VVAASVQVLKKIPARVLPVETAVNFFAVLSQ
jgi:hypothetical protein